MKTTIPGSILISAALISSALLSKNIEAMAVATSIFMGLGVGLLVHGLYPEDKQ